VHRFRPKSVFPVALVRPHDVQCVARISLFASAQESTTSPVGRKSGFPLQLNSRGSGEEADAAVARTATATTLGKARQDNRLIVASRSRFASSIARTSRPPIGGNPVLSTRAGGGDHVACSTRGYVPAAAD